MNSGMALPNITGSTETAHTPEWGQKQVISNAL